MGVRRAVDIVLDIAQHEKNRRIYTYGPLIQNPQTLNCLKDAGLSRMKTSKQ
jgi:4-hydroxy-3-methylbut-2-enyl diphosphate reductase